MVMGIMLLVVVVSLGVWLSLRRAKWKVVLTATGPDAGELEAKYEHLKSNRIKCALETEGPAISAGIVQPELVPDALGTVVKLKVHAAYVQQAKQLLEQFPEAM